MNEVTCILDRAQQGDPMAAEELLPLVYEPKAMSGEPERRQPTS
jgi:hypothetical protein